MNRMLVIVLAVSLVLVAATGCGKDTQTSNDPVAVIQENVKAMNEKDLGRMLATIDEQSPSYDQTKLIAKKLFDMYDLKYEVDSLKVISQTDDEARVECVQTTSKLKGPAFRDNRIAFIHSLKKSDGNWKIYNSYVKKLDYLN